MDSQKQQVLARIKQANNILVTVSANPSVDQLASCLGLTIMLTELGKHATAVFSGKVPSTIKFLQPEKTLERNTDSLRDFIIALDKSKADKLRYKVEDRVVKIFITPYRTSIGEKDLEFSQGDFNVEVVVALGVHEQKDLDQAITAHGRILHDATVISINTTAGNNIGTINWQSSSASSLSEMVTSLSENFDRKVLDNQVATALLTGIVSETDRFSNGKTTPETMKASAMLMSAGANQQLVATKLQEPIDPLPLPVPEQQDNDQTPEPPRSPDGALRIEHDEKLETFTPPSYIPEGPEEVNGGPQIHIDNQGLLRQLDADHRLASDSELPREIVKPPSPGNTEKSPATPNETSRFVFNPPTSIGKVTSSVNQEETDPILDSLSLPEVDRPILSHEGLGSSHHIIEPPEPGKNVYDVLSDSNHVVPTIPVPPSHAGPPDTTTATKPDSRMTLTDLEKSVNSPHAKSSDVSNARNAVNSAIDESFEPIAALNAQPLSYELHQNDVDNNQTGNVVPPLPPGNPNFYEPAPDKASPSAKPLDMPSMSWPQTFIAKEPDMTPPTSPDNDSSAPPGPPPINPVGY